MGWANVQPGNGRSPAVKRCFVPYLGDYRSERCRLLRTTRTTHDTNRCDAPEQTLARPPWWASATTEHACGGHTPTPRHILPNESSRAMRYRSLLYPTGYSGR